MLSKMQSLCQSARKVEELVNLPCGQSSGKREGLKQLIVQLPGVESV